jgi:hypothetical protein
MTIWRPPARLRVCPALGRPMRLIEKLLAAL